MHAVKKYPLPPHFKIRHLWHLISVLIFYLEACVLIVRKKRNTKAVVVFDRILGILPLIVARITRTKTVFIENNIWPWSYRGEYRPEVYYLQIALGKLAIRNTSILFANSESIKDGMHAVGIKEPAIHILPSGIDSKSVPRRNRKRDRIAPLEVLYAGRLVEERGADMLEDIIRKTLSSSQNIRFTIAGGGPLLDNLRALEFEYNSDRVRVLNQVSHSTVKQLMSVSDIVLFISKNENYPSLALLESMLIGCPVIATDVGSTKTFVQDRKNGLLAKPTPGFISDAILFAAESFNLIDIMGDNARLTAMQSDWSIVSSIFLQYI